MRSWKHSSFSWQSRRPHDKRVQTSCLALNILQGH